MEEKKKPLKQEQGEPNKFDNLTSEDSLLNATFAPGENNYLGDTNDKE